MWETGHTAYPRIYERTRLVIKQVYKIEMIVEINAQDDY